MELLALGDGQLALRDAVAKINLQRNDGHPLLLRLNHQTINFAPLEQQFALPQRVVIAKPAGQILRDVEIDQPDSPAFISA